MSGVICEFTVKNRFENLVRTKLISQDQVTMFEKLLGENLITSVIPLNQFTVEPTSVNFDYVYDILKEKISNFSQARSYDVDQTLSKFYKLKAHIAVLVEAVMRLDTDYLVSYLKNDSKSYVFDSEHKVVDIRNMELEEALNRYPIWRDGLLNEKGRKYFLEPLETLDDDRKPETMLPNYFPLFSVFYYVADFNSKKELIGNDLIPTSPGFLENPNIYTHNILVKDLISIFENIFDVVNYLEYVKSLFSYKIYDEVETLNPQTKLDKHKDEVDDYDFAVTSSAIFDHGPSVNLLYNLKQKDE